MNTRVRHQWPFAFAVVVFAIALMMLGRTYLAATEGHRVYALDDSYIQMALAKDLAAHGVWGITRYEFSGSGTSLIWPILLAAIERVAGRHDVTPFVLNCAFGVALLCLAQGLLRRHVRSRACQFLALAILVFATPLVVLPFIGMEHALQCLAALALAAVVARMCATRDARERRVMIAIALPASAVAVGVRYDTASVVIAGIVIAVACRERLVAAGMAACGLAPAAVYAFVAGRQGWPAVPVSVLMKRRLGGVDPWTWHGLLDVLGGGGLTVLVDSPPLFVLVLAALALLWWDAHAGNHAADAIQRESRLLLIVFLIATLVHVQFGRLGWLYRYEAYLVMLGIVANGSALSHLRLWRQHLQWSVEAAIGILVAALLLQPLMLRSGRAWRDAISSGGGEYRNQYRLAVFLQRHPQGPVILESLTPAYLIDAPIVDVSGLGTLEVWEGVSRGSRTGDVANVVARKRHARVMVASPFEAAEEWVCLAGWREHGTEDGDQQFFYAADAASAATLTRDLRAFEAEDVPRGVDLTWASAMPGGQCPVH